MDSKKAAPAVLRTKRC